MRTCEHLAAAAGQLKVLLQHGQNDLADRPGEVRLAAHLRDQVAQNLAHTLRTAATHLDALGGHTPVVGSAADVARALTDRCTGVAGPAPTQLAVHPPGTRSAQAWAGVGRELEAAAVQAGRADRVDALTWCAATADAAAVASALTWVDVDLGRALIWTGAAELTAAGSHLLGAGVDRVRRDTLTTMTLLDAHPLPDQYHLRAPVHGVAPVPTPDLIPVAVDRAHALLTQPGSLTARQHRAVHTAVAAIAHRLGVHADASDAAAAATARSALTRYANAQIGLAGAWAHANHLWCTQPGSWDAPTQLRAVAQLLAEHPSPSRIPLTQIRDAAVGLVGVTAAAGRDLAETVAREHWIAAYRDDRGATCWDVLWPDYGPQPWSRSASRPDTVIANRLAWMAAGVPVTAYRLGDVRDDGRIGSPRGVQDLTRIIGAHEAAAEAGTALHAALGSTGTEPTPTTTSPRATARQVLRGAATPNTHPAGQSDGQPASGPDSDRQAAAVAASSTVSSTGALLIVDAGETVPGPTAPPKTRARGR